MTTKLRILCLHGFTSNGAVHAHQMRHITSQLPEYEFLFPDGPHAVDIATQMDLSKPPNQAWSDVVMGIGPTAGHRAWWYARDGAFGNSTTGGFWGLEESLRSLGDFLREKGPVHAITGFSQGACFAGMLVALLQERGAESSLKQHLGDVTGTEARAGVIFSGFRARFSQYDELYEGGIQVPTLHCIGEKDDAVRGERSEELIKVCEGAEELTHFGGHNIPKSKEDHMRIMKFLRRWVAGAEGERVPASL